MKKLLLCFLALMFTSALAMGARLPGDSERLLPVLSEEIDTYWSDLTPRAFPAGVIDQESNWKVTAMLRTSRETGCGLGQFTVAYDAKGNVRFDALAEARALSSALKDWDWRDCQAYQYQLRAVIIKLKVHNRNCLVSMTTNDNVKACAAAQYNGGVGSFTKRLRTCRLTPGCNPTEWFGNLEKQCPQSTTKVAGYGESFCDINSKYPGRVFSRMVKFQQPLNDIKAAKNAQKISP